MPISHVGLSCGPSTFKVMRDFYVELLSPLGYRVFMEKDGVVIGFQAPRAGPDFWLHVGGEDIPQIDPTKYAEEKLAKQQPSRTHVAFDVSSRQLVHDWYQIALKSGGVDNGKPGPRPEYHKDYYSAFVIDPLGNNIEVVYFEPLFLKAIKLAPSVASILVGVVGGFLASQYYN